MNATKLKQRPRGTATLSIVQPLSFVAAMLLLLMLSPALAFHSKGARLDPSARTRSTAFYDSNPTSPLKYQHRDGEAVGWGKLPPPSNTVEDDSKQAVVDDYLEFLDRRYIRLRGEDSQYQGEIKFSAWQWLTKGGADDALMEHQDADHDNALFVLGVAGLASQKLLQKRHLLLTPNGSADKRPKTQLAAQARTTNAGLVPSMIGKLHDILNRLSHQRSLLLRYQREQVKALVRVLVKTIRAGPSHLVKRAFKLGGGGKTVAITLTAMGAILFFVVGPMACAIVSEGAQHA
jgi:hypothetical protein